MIATPRARASAGATRLLGTLAMAAAVGAGCPEDPGRPEGWTEATHGDEAAPDYDLLFDDTVVHRFDIEITAADHAAAQADLAAKLSGGGPGADLSVEDPMWVPVTVRFGGGVWTRVGMRYKGNSSLRAAWQSGIRKLAFRLDFDRFEDEYPEVRNQRFHGFREMTFGNGFADPSLLRDKLAADVFRAGGVPAARGAFAAVHADWGAGPVYFGLYTMIEDPSDRMIETQFAGGGNLYKPEGDGADWVAYVPSGFPKKTNEDTGDEDVRAAVAALHADRGDAAAWRADLERTFDAPAFLRCLAINQAIVNWDSYGCMPHNYYLYGDPTAGGRLVWFPWDLNESLTPASRSRCSPESVLLDEVGNEWPLIRFLLDDTHYRGIYRDELARAVEGAIPAAASRDRVERLHSLIAPYVIGPESVETAPYTFLRRAEEFTGSLRGTPGALLDHLAARRTTVLEALP